MSRGGARNISEKKTLRKELFVGAHDQRFACEGCEQLFKTSSLKALTPDGENKFCFQCRSLMQHLLEELTSKGDLDAYYQRTYNITFKGYSHLFFRQGGKCAICQNTPRDKRLFVDHCHDTQLVRGLLCQLCNNGLGMFKDSVPSLAKAIVYLTQ